MPIGVLINCGAVCMGGLCGGCLREIIPQHLKDTLPIIFGISAIVLGINKINDLNNIVVVILSIIVGYIIGESFNIENLIERLGAVILKNKKEYEKDKESLMSAALIIFCFSGTGIFGALNEGISGDSMVLISKSVLDFFTACIFSSIVGFSISLISIVQFAVLFSVYLSALFLSPYMTPYVIGNFVAVGGVITMIIGLNLSQITSIKSANVLPSIVLSIVFSFLINI